MRRAFFIVTSFLGLEAEVLKGFCGFAIEPGSGGVLTAASGQVALCHPRGCAMADRFELLCTCLGGAQHLLRLVEPSLLHQRTAQHELGRSDVEQEIFAVAEELERVASFLLGGLHLAGHQVDVGEDRKSTRLNSSHMSISYAVFCLKKKKKKSKIHGSKRKKETTELRK